MRTIAFHELVGNVGLLFLLGFIYELGYGLMRVDRRARQVVRGVLAGGVGLLIMAVPFNLAPGIVYDTRSILVSVTAFSFGPVPGAIAAGMTALARVLRGGTGMAAGVGTIVTSFLAGWLWRRVANRMKHWREQFLPLLLLGLLVHLAMLACQWLLLPDGTGAAMIRTIWLPVMTIYPLGTAVLGTLLLWQQQQREAVRRVTAAEERYRALFENANAVMWLVEPDTGRIVDANPAAASFYGWSREQLLAMNVSVINTLSQEEILAEMRDAKENKRHYFLFQHQLANSEVRHVEVYSSPIVLEGKDLLYSIIHDVTARVQAEKALSNALGALQAARDSAEDASNAKSSFLASMSHEIRTPLNGIYGFLQLLELTGLSTEQREYTGHIRASTNMLLSVINSILDFSKADADKLVLEQAPFALSATIHEIIALFTPKAAQKGLGMSVRLAPDLPGLVMGDALRLKQVLGNLVGNALKFTEQGWIRVKVAVAGETDSHWLIRFTVADSGIGLSAEQQEKLFVPFMQADASITRKYGGTGLGLALSKHLVAMMNGHIGVQSALGKGASFWFEIPFNKPDAEQGKQGVRPHSPLSLAQRAAQLGAQASGQPVAPGQYRAAVVLAGTPDHERLGSLLGGKGHQLVPELLHGRLGLQRIRVRQHQNAVPGFRPGQHIRQPQRVHGTGYPVELAGLPQMNVRVQRLRGQHLERRKRKRILEPTGAVRLLFGHFEQLLLPQHPGMEALCHQAKPGGQCPDILVPQLNPPSHFPRVAGCLFPKGGAVSSNRVRVRLTGRRFKHQMLDGDKRMPLVGGQIDLPALNHVLRRPELLSVAVGPVQGDRHLSELEQLRNSLLPG
jgi:PAS domain S-box-containing protein